MFRVDWKSECRFLFLVFSLTVLIGWIIDAISFSLLVVAACYIAWNLLQLQRVLSWLSNDIQSDLPEARGLWGAVFQNLHHLQRQGHQEKERLQGIVEYLRDSFASMDDAAVMIDKTGSIEWSNRAALKLLGLRYPEDVHQQLTNLIRSPEFIDYYESGDYKEPLQIDSPYNRNYKLHINVSYFGKGSRLLFARDNTQTHLFQQMRTDFVANVSHELRTPLTVINGYLETLSDDVGVVDETLWRQAIEKMLTQSHRMEALVKNLIILSRIESVPKVTDQNEIDMLPMLQMIREEALTAVGGNREINIDCDSLLKLLGNEDELQSAFTNLIINAAKYTQPNGVIDIRWFVDQNNAFLEVEDDGVGIDQYHLPRITERFYRVDKSRSINTGGTGLGLAIVKHILIHHQAELTIDSELGEGSIFTCVFPLARVRTEQQEAS